MTAGVRFGDVRSGDRLAPVTMPISYTRVCQNAAATFDWMPGHHDPAYARAQGQETIYLSTLFFTGFVDRCVTDWAGPEAFICRRRITMTSPIYAGETATVTGEVTDKYERKGRHYWTLRYEVRNSAGAICLENLISCSVD